MALWDKDEKTGVGPVEKTDEKQNKEPRYTMSEEVAKDQLSILLDSYDLDIEDSENESDIKKLIKSIRRGGLEILDIDDEKNTTDDVMVTQHLRSKTILSYHIIDGKSKMAMKKYDTGDHYGKLYAFLGSLSGSGPDAIRELKGLDLTTAESLGLILLQV